MFAPKHILVPTDFSEYSDAALQKAVDIAAQCESKVYLLHVVTQQYQQFGVDYSLTSQLVTQLEKESLKGAKAKLKKEADAIVKSKGLKISFDIKVGIPHELILSEQKAKKVDLIVISSHGKTGLLKQLIGSVTEKVVKGARCPVMVVKP